MSQHTVDDVLLSPRTDTQRVADVTCAAGVLVQSLPGFAEIVRDVTLARHCAQSLRVKPLPEDKLGRSRGAQHRVSTAADVVAECRAAGVPVQDAHTTGTGGETRKLLPEKYFAQFYMMYQGLKLMERYTEMTGIHYDWVVRSRPDICGVERIRLTKQTLLPGTILMTGGRLDDKFWVGDHQSQSVMMGALAKDFAVIDDYYDPSLRDKGLGRDPESFIRWKLEQHFEGRHVKVKNWKYTLTAGKCPAATVIKRARAGMYTCPSHLAPSPG